MTTQTQTTHTYRGVVCTYDDAARTWTAYVQDKHGYIRFQAARTLAKLMLRIDAVLDGRE